MADKNSQSKNVNSDAGLDIDLTDLEDISLEDLDDFEGIDFDNLELDDIDFDDLDVTNLDTGITYQKEPLDTNEFDFDFDSLMAEDKKPEDVKEVKEEKNQKKPEKKAESVKADKTPEDDGNVFSDAEATMRQDTAEPTQEDIDAFLSALNEESSSIDEERSDSEDYSGAGSDLDDLFKQSMELSLENGELDDIEDRSGDVQGGKSKGEKGKKSLSEILFGEPDEDDLEEERLLAERKAQKEIKKAENAEKKSEKKALKDAKKQEALAVKDKAGRDKAAAKAALKAKKKAAREAEYQAELEEEKDQKPVPTAVVVIVFALFAAMGAFVILGTKGFDYKHVVQKATEYFERQRYRLAYDEIAGVEVKAKDEDLKDRIYTVMYVERLYESYENNMTLGRPEKALDSLIRGLQKYDEHYDEAVELNISGDIDTCKQEILAALSETFSMTEDDAYAVMDMDGQSYTEALTSYAEPVRAAQEAQKAAEEEAKEAAEEAAAEGTADTAGE
jgi:hypothetical protein